MEVKVKRGRKPKILTENVIPIEKKKRGRKPSCQIFEIKELDTIMNNIPEECIIAHLPIYGSDIDNIIKSESNNVDNDNECNKINFGIDNEFNDNSKSESVCKECDILNEKIKFLTEQLVTFKNYSVDNSASRNLDDKQLLENTIHIEEIYKNRIVNKNLLCWWCCNTFDTLPLGLPFKYYNNIFYVYGYFCSFNCCLAYNYNMNDYNTWERTSLLYNYKNKILKTSTIIKCAPPKESLSIFGGTLSIEQFRNNTIVLNKNYRLIIPLTISLCSITEVLDDNYFCNNTYTNNDKNDNSLILKRTKPVLKNKKSLITLMKINI